MDGRAVRRRHSHQNHSEPTHSLWEGLNRTQSQQPGQRPRLPERLLGLVPGALRLTTPESEATYLQIKPPLSHLRLASVFSGKSSSGLWRTSTSTDNSAWTRGLRRSSSADTMSWKEAEAG